eukprot:2119434-Amphidinium_carterae.1
MEEQLRQPLKLSSCKWTPDQARGFQQIGKARNLVGHRLNEARRESFESLDPTSDAVLARMQSFHPPARPEREVPAWMKHLCRLREYTTGAILSITDEDKHGYYWILYALLSPMTLCLKPIERCADTLPNLSQGMPPEEMLRVCNMQAPETFRMASDFIVLPHASIQDVVEVHVLMDVAFSQDNFLQSWSAWQSVDTLWEASGPTSATRAQAQRTPSAQPSIPSADLAQYPWLEQYLHKETEKTEPDTKRVRRVIPEHADEDALDQAYRVFQDKKRDFLAEVGLHAMDDFTTALKGGQWTQAVLKVPYHLCEAKARSLVAIEWVQKAGLNKVASFSFGKYGEEASSLLAVTWCARMTWLIETFSDADAVPKQHREATLASFVEPASAGRLRRGNAKKQHVLKRLDEILKLVPFEKAVGRVSASSGVSESSTRKTCETFDV